MEHESVPVNPDRGAAEGAAAVAAAGAVVAAAAGVAVVGTKRPLLMETDECW